jgi:ABC-type nitrate/sulfonate/bicarbonate transport system substrate-binding protein
LVLQTAHGASAPTKVTIHVPSKSLSIMPYYFGKDKGFFAAEQIEPQLVMMAPPTAIAAMVAGELDFSSTTGAATSATMRGLPLRRVFYVQQDPVHVLLAQPEIKSVGGDRQDRRRDGLDRRGGHVDERDSARPWH